MINLEEIYKRDGWDATQEFYDSLKRSDGTVPYKYFRQYHTLARKIQLESQGPITDESIKRLEDSRTCLCRRDDDGKLLICRMCKNK